MIGDSYSSASDMLARFKIVAYTAEADDLMQLSDAVDATSLPAFSMQEAVESMQKIVDKANELKKKEREEFILNFITGLLFFIPFAGQAAGAAGMTATRSLLRLIGSTGDAALATYTLIQDPANAFLTIFGYLAGAGVGRGGFQNAASARRGMGSKELDSLGGVKTSLNRAQSLRGALVCPA